MQEVLGRNIDDRNAAHGQALVLQHHPHLATAAPRLQARPPPSAPPCPRREKCGPRPPRPLRAAARARARRLCGARKCPPSAQVPLSRSRARALQRAQGRANRAGVNTGRARPDAAPRRVDATASPHPSTRARAQSTYAPNSAEAVRRTPAQQAGEEPKPRRCLSAVDSKDFYSTPPIPHALGSARPPRPRRARPRPVSSYTLRLLPFSRNRSQPPQPATRPAATPAQGPPS